jgi:hypothetical protein
MSHRHESFAIACLRSTAATALISGMFYAVAHAAPPVTVTTKVPYDGPVQYTVKVTSKQFGNAQDTRTIRSGETDDFTWKSVPSGGPVAAASQCPNYELLPLDANGAAIRQMQIRLAPVVAPNGTASVQMSFHAQTPRGTAAVKVGGKEIQCPKKVSASQIVRFTISTNGGMKRLKLSDGTQVVVSTKR